MRGPDPQLAGTSRRGPPHARALSRDGAASDAIGHEVRWAPPRRFRLLSAISDRWIVAGSAATAIGALWAPDVPWWCGAAALIAGAARRTRVLLPAGLLLLAAAAMGQQAQNLSEAAGGSFDGEAVIVADPHWRQGALTVPVSVEIQGREHRWEGWSRGAAAYGLEDAAVGEHWRISGVAETAEPRGPSVPVATSLRRTGADPHSAAHRWRQRPFSSGECGEGPDRTFECFAVTARCGTSGRIRLRR